MEKSELYKSLQRDIERKLENAKKHLESYQEKLKKPNQKLGFIDKLSTNSSIKSYQEKVSKLTELNQLISKLYFENSEKFKLPNELETQIGKLGTLLSAEETKLIQEAINRSLKDVNKDSKEKINESILKIQKLLSQLNLANKNFQLYNNQNQYTGTDLFFTKAIQELETIKLNELTPTFLNINSSEIQISTNDSLFLSSLEDMIKNNQLEKNKNTQNIINNFNSIKNSFKTKAKLNETLLVISNTLLELQKIKHIDLSKVQTLLKQIETKYRKELDKTNEFLSKFDFTNIKKQIKENGIQNEQNQINNSKFFEYQQLAYELEKINTINPNDYDKINQIQEQMRNIANTSGLTNDQLKDALEQGKDKFRKEQRDKEINIQANREKREHENQLHADAARQLRQAAIRELELEGAFKENYIAKNGEAYAQPIDNEALIQRKIAEFKRIADMTPEQRALEELKRNGSINPNTQIEDLSPQQISDFKYAYRDESYDFIAAYKKYQQSAQIKPKANNIYREYILYLAKLNDKTERLSFAEFAKQKYNVENINEHMVDEDLKQEMGGISK